MKRTNICLKKEKNEKGKGININKVRNFIFNNKLEFKQSRFRYRNKK